MIEKTDGIVLSERDYGESSKIINVLTKEHGLIGIMAKGAKKLKSELRGGTGKLSYGTFDIYYKEDKLSTMISIDIIDSFKEIKKDLYKISYASYLLDLSEQVEKQSNSHSVYDLLISSLKKINEGYDPLVITNILELKYLDLLGVMPVLDSCCICGSTNGIVTLSNIKGGYICRKCYTNEKIVDEKTIKLIRMFYYVDIDKISKLEVSNKAKIEVNNFLDAYYDQYTGLYLKSKSFLKELNRI